MLMLLSLAYDDLAESIYSQLFTLNFNCLSE